ncbi:MAG: type II toxin-antitoxin system VapC family toxin [Spirochaetia bacterium]
MTYLLDTNTCIYIINKKPPSVVKRIRARRPEDIAISTITIAELEYGVARSKFPERNRAALMEFLLPFSILEFDQIAATFYGIIRSGLDKMGNPIGSMDMLLAAQARSRNLTMVTNNESEFKRVEGLEIENWARPYFRGGGDA